MRLALLISFEVAFGSPSQAVTLPKELRLRASFAR
jgi:virulence-associated protein VagC